jgi:hypothetical protein
MWCDAQRRVAERGVPSTKVSWLIARQLQDSAAVVVVISFVSYRKRHDCWIAASLSLIYWMAAVRHHRDLIPPKAAGRRLAVVLIGAPTTSEA